MTDTPRPSPSPAAGDREALARIIDPEVWATFDNSPMGQSARNRRRSIRDSLAKADQWLSAKRGEAEPVLWRVKDFADGWILFHDEAEARREAAHAGNLVEPLYTHPAPAADKASTAPSGEVVTEAMMNAGYDATRLADGTPQFADAGFCLGHTAVIYQAMRQAALTALPTGSGDKAGTRDDRQRSVAEWCAAAFGVEHQTSIPQRGLRHAEEAIEAAQAARVDPAQLHALIDYIYAKPPGDLKQELGGSGVTLLALAAAAGVSADDAEAAELARVLAKPLKWFHDRNQVKNDAGFDALSYPSAALAQTEKAK